ncbi:SIR2 family protein [Mycobacterium sp. ML4]
MSGFTDGSWQSLEADSGTDDDARAASAAAKSSLHDELGLVVNAETLVVLAGSGTSLGITSEVEEHTPPRMSDLWAAVSGIAAFKDVENKLSADVFATKNLEHVLSDAQARLALALSDSDLEAFVAEAEDIVWQRCNFIDENSDVGAHELFLRKVARRSTRLQRSQIFTTNYDLAFETAARRARFNVIDGFGYGGHEFDGGSFDLDYVRRRPNEQLILEPSVFQLLKLHGSVDWTANGSTVSKTVGRPDNPVLIYPSAAKYQMSYQQPYLEFMSRFQIALRQPDVGLLVVGFGFNDEHLNAPIAAAVRSNIGLRAVVVTPGARDSGRAPSIAWIEDLITRGDRRLSILSGTFDDLVRHLPDVPPQEERDAHAERMAPRRPGEVQ